MVKVMLFVGLAGALCLFALVGIVLFVVGLFKKNRPLKVAGLLASLVSILLLGSGLVYASVKIVHRVKSVDGASIWSAIVDVLADDSHWALCAPGEARRILSHNLGNPPFAGNLEVQGVWVDRFPLYYGCFLYQADTQEVLKAVAAAPLDPIFLMDSDTACLEATWEEIRDDLMYKYGPQRKIPGWNPEAVADRRCYRCLRCPWSHSILIDGKTGKIYHAIMEIRE
jgi:hypothetical protein